MARPPLEVADLIRAAGDAFIERNRHWLRWKHIKVLLAIRRCRTAALGGHLDECTRCGYRAAISYNSCPNRHCPKCQIAARERWIAAGREKLLSTRSDPAFPCSDLTPRAVAIAAAVIGDGGTIPATGALIEMTAECGSTTPPNGQQHFDVLPTEPVAISFDEGISCGADQIGHLEWWPGHLLFLRRTAFERQ